MYFFRSQTLNYLRKIGKHNVDSKGNQDTVKLSGWCMLKAGHTHGGGVGDGEKVALRRCME